MDGIEIRQNSIRVVVEPGSTCTIRVVNAKGGHGRECILVNQGRIEEVFVVSTSERLQAYDQPPSDNNPIKEHLARPSEVGPVLGGGKLRLRLVPSEAIRAIARVLGWSGTKGPYKDWDWLTKYTVTDCWESAFRHIIEGGDDPESGLPHLEHALTRLAMAIELKKRGLAPPKGPHGE